MRFPRLTTWKDQLAPTLHSKWTYANGYRLHARVSHHEAHHRRLPIILVHGLAMSSRYLLPTAECLAQRYCVYVPDLPGFGKSEKPDRALTIRELADVLLAWMDEMKLERAALIGNSLGCQIILDLAARHPERAERIILSGPTVDPGGRSGLRLIARTAWDAFNEPPSLLAIAFYDYLRAGVPRTLRTLNYTVNDKVEHKLVQVRMPALIIRGANDRIVPQTWVEDVHRMLPDSRLEIIQQAAHGINYSRPQEFARLTERFLEERFS